MRLGSFIVGGLFGAAVVYMMNSRMTSGLMSALGSSLSSGMMGNTSQSSSSNMGKSSSSGSHANSNAANSSSGTDAELEGLKKFKQMIAQDSQLKQTIKEMIKQDETASHQTASKH